MRLVNILGAESVQHPEHGDAQAGSDGVFEVSEPFGQALLAHAAQWRTEAEHVALLAQQRLRELADPQRAAEVLDYVHGKVAALEARVAELEGKAAEPQQPEQPEQPPASPEQSPAKTTKTK